MRLSWEDQINGMEVTAFAYLDLLAMLPASIKERLPSFTEVLRILFQSYFTIIELKYLKQWSESTFSSIPERLMSNQEAYKLIISLAKEEMLKRDQAMSGLTHDQHPDGRVLTPNEVRKKMVISAEQRNMLIGFMRDEQGKIQPVFSHSPRLLSVREGISAGRWRPGRLVEMVPLAIGGQELGIDTTENWYYLPSDLKQIFEKHKVLVTAKEVSTPFQLLMYSPQDEERKKRQGRTGVLFRDGLPIIIEIRGKEFIVELKGAGLPSGGFDRENAGAVDIFSAQRELLNLEEEKKGQAYVHGETVRAAANIRLMGGKGYLVRLSPGSIRSSFQDNDAIPVMKTSRKVYLMSREIGRFFREGKVLMSHPENFIVDRNGENLISTDYADVFYIQVFPKKLEDEDITPKAAIEISLDFIREITGYAKEPHEIFRMFVGGLADGLELPLPEKEQLMGLANMKEVVEFIWQKIFVKAYWESITANGVIPERLINLPLDLDTGIEKGLLEGVETETRRLYRALKAQFERDNDNQTAPSLLAEMENTHFIGPQIVEATISSPALERLVFGVRHKNIPNSGQPELLAHLKEQIEILQDMVPYFDGHSQKEINWNLKIAQEKYQRIASMKTNEFLMAALRDKDFIVGMFMLPYYAHLKGNSFGPGTVRYESKMRLIATHNSGLVDLSVPQDEAQLAPGGIDLTSLKSLSVQHNGQGIKFHIEPAMLAQLQNAPGFIPVIINMQPLRDLRAFLELADS